MLLRPGPLDFVNVFKVQTIAGCGIAVTFNDGTKAFYPPEELAVLRPYREAVEDYILPTPFID